MRGVSPQVLRWARETAGLSLEEAAPRLGFKPSRKGAPVDRLAALEAGEADPSRAQVVRASKAYRRPLITFYLPAPPPAAPGITDFRTLPEPGHGRAEANLQTLVRDVRVRQSLVRDLLDDEETPERPFPGSISRGRGVDVARVAVEQAIGWRAEEFRRTASADKAFDYLRRLVEEAGIYVLLIGDLGNYISAFDVETFRGFALADPVAPFIVVNDQDAKGAWAFTLLHELVHIGLGESGVSGKEIHGDVERFCNDVASAILLPADELRQLNLAGPAFDEIKEAIARFAQTHRVSGSMVAYRLFLDGRIDRALWQDLAGSFLADWRRSKAAQKEKPSSPDFYTVRRHRLGQALLNVVRRNVEGGQLTPVRAAKVLGVSPRGVDPLLAGRTG